MISLWNRKEVFIGYSMKNFNKCREILNLNKIRYIYRVVNPHGSKFFGANRSYRSTFGEKIEYDYEYHIYVHRDDYEKAMKVIRV
ncbi:hypothetical protein [Paratissierella segnis]|jgi:hypothetical protein|uniref:Uncharacterized protein n=1 Tax=Paratissierella segnis TaxID=2763679 RepID=A0A926IFA0_9FIRM|nr:hypothetical protein [Paratissierella segnis]MBC8588267.1 hypothetical protein [Paratissierella segnis]